MTWLTDLLDSVRTTHPEHPCREMPTRACPMSYGGVCGDRPCARFESDDEAPWQADLEHDRKLGLWTPR